MPTYAERYAWLRQPTSTDSTPHFCRPVFKLSLFGRIAKVKRGENERLCPFFQNIVLAVTKHAFKTVALAASLSALEIRGRYAINGYMESFERPFRWTDPAEPLICHTLNTKALHIPSPKPFSIPHILVEFSFENDSDIMKINCAPSQQCPSGLTVLQRTSAAACDDVDEEGYDSFEEDLIEPSTPISLRRIGRCFFGKGEDDESTLIEFQDYAQNQTQLLYIPNATTYHNEVKARFFIDEDEDDGPPEYDNWFLSIAQRTKTQFP
ncbi:hypothetical protein CPB83DRAFT_888658 [Crepidotus variabilis]|uniref:Uncharacterized protein n=1 Tax=Crepidotus variabilis TaxID=179855 RepID=A0A9P6ERD1_9AGAR|nr:hypothetical protein CPB83DRAFT_888658 [Crepidotus variabilis]